MLKFWVLSYNLVKVNDFNKRFLAEKESSKNYQILQTKLAEVQAQQEQQDKLDQLAAPVQRALQDKSEQQVALAQQVLRE